MQARMGMKEPPKYIEKVFEGLANEDGCMSATELVSFLVAEQGERWATEDYAASLISQFHGQQPPTSTTSPPSLNLHQFFRFLLNPQLNSLMRISAEPTQDMTAPLSHYLIYTSHNSYLTGNQLTSKSGTAIIERALQAGCRVIELDCWGHEGEIMVLHGHTLTKPVHFEDCLRAIKENAFVTSEYPVIITIENHLPLDLQVEASRMIRDILGDTLFVPAPEEKTPLVFASPEDLKYKIIISDTPPNDPLQEQAIADPQELVERFPYIEPYPTSLQDDESPPLSPISLRNEAKKGIARQIERAASGGHFHHGHSSHRGTEQRVPELDELIYIYSEKPAQIQDESAPGLHASTKRSIMANVSEPQLKKLIKEDAASLIKYTKNNLGRMYPYGLRFDSSNADPFLAWAHGFQLAALNMQGQDRPCWIAQALFNGNGKCGYVKKPRFLLPSSDLTMDAAQDMGPAVLLKIKILTAVSCNNTHKFRRGRDLYVKISIDGLPFDRAKKRTDTIRHHGEPIWDHQTFQFPIRAPSIAVLRLEVWDYDVLSPHDFVGQACFYVAELRTGIRAAPLKSRTGDLLGSSLLCWVHMGKWAAIED